MMRSVFAILKLENKWLRGMDVFQVFATGAAADVAAAGQNKVLLSVLKDNASQDDD